MEMKYLTFDCYGTLVDWRAGIEKALREAVGNVRLGGQVLLEAYVAAESDQEYVYKKYREVLRDTLVSMSGTIGVDVSRGEAEEFAESVPRWPVFPDSGPFLREMGSRGYKRYILSNVDDDLLEQTIRVNHLDVDGFVTAEQIGSYKPGPGHWQEFMKRTGASKREFLHVAQSLYHDIAPCKALGVRSAWVNRYGEPLPLGASPEVIADGLGALRGVVESGDT
jgi:2-haloacid dehalogenase